MLSAGRSATTRFFILNEFYMVPFLPIGYRNPNEEIFRSCGAAKG
jgi:hypothetical protein